MGQGTDIELWGGIEATRNRVGLKWFDQLDRSGHTVRLDDLDRIAALGIRTLRYPILWERIAPDGLDTADWTWPDERLTRLRTLGVRPIITFVHHGSGPAGVDLLNPAFADRLGEFAGAVAVRYPWLTDFTPVNEPLTTARFSALYGHWYPHLRDMRSMINALLNQTHATIQAMAAIRAVIPGARLVQTEDIGKTFSTPLLRPQADFDNERRWLSLDLLCGTVRPGHPLWEYLLSLPIDPLQLEAIAEAETPPDIIGVNYYVTGERFLDERIGRYPVHTHGGNGQVAFADVEAVRVRPEGLYGLNSILAETRDRFQRPLAVTECHLGSTPDEQLRWLEESWHATANARANGIDVCALTIWSLFGSFDWNSLVTRDEGIYEAGVFDVRGLVPQETALASWVRARARGLVPHNVTRATPGWWRRSDRLLYPTDLPIAKPFSLTGD